MSVMKFKSVGYWVSTALIAAAFVLGGAIDTAAQPSALAFLAHLGYPAYFATLIGVWKVLGGLAVLAPGAAVSHASSGDGAAKVMVPLVLVAIGFASWSLRPRSRRLDAAASKATSSTRFNDAANAAA